MVSSDHAVGETTSHACVPLYSHAHPIIFYWSVHVYVELEGGVREGAHIINTYISVCIYIEFYFVMHACDRIVE